MILACQKLLGQITKVLGFGETLPPPYGKNSQKVPYFFLTGSLRWRFLSVAFVAIKCWKYSIAASDVHGIHSITTQCLQHLRMQVLTLKYAFFIMQVCKYASMQVCNVKTQKNASDCTDTHTGFSIWESRCWAAPVVIIEHKSSACD